MKTNSCGIFTQALAVCWFMGLVSGAAAQSSISPVNTGLKCRGASGHYTLFVGKHEDFYCFCTNSALKPIKITASGVPDDAVMRTSAGSIPPRGKVVDPPFAAKISFTPTAAQCSKKYRVNISAVQRRGRAKDSCSFDIDVRCNKPPECNAGAPQLDIPCLAETTQVQLNGTGSTDPEGKPLKFKWKMDPACEGFFNDDQSPTPVFTTPSSGSSGEPVHCGVGLTVSDGYYRRSCRTRFTIALCKRDCTGTINGTKVYDACGVCGGDGSTCAGCDGVPNSGKEYDACGVCGGDGSTCAGCDGVPNSGKQLDVCGVCGGDGTSCLDCNGVPFGGGGIDPCGVCVDETGTPGSSCICNASNLADKKFGIDTVAYSEYFLARVGIRLLQKTRRKTAIRFNEKRGFKKLKKAYEKIQSVVISQIPDSNVTCPESAGCIEVESSSTVKEIKNLLSLIYRIGKRALVKVRKHHGSIRKFNQVFRRLKHNRKAARMAVNSIDDVLTAPESCAGPIILSGTNSVPISF